MIDDYPYSEARWCLHNGIRELWPCRHDITPGGACLREFYRQRIRSLARGLRLIEKAEGDRWFYRELTRIWYEGP